tara:strand:- start:45593 stop:46645 length:1053 start_codon:yes stop_codon:yes gene_type:complete
MEFDRQLLFFFSALGGFNGILLSFYFLFFIKIKNRSTYFLSALIFVLSVRVIKSVFLSFYPGTSSAFIQVGLTACFLIGPFLYLYVHETTKTVNESGKKWMIHILPYIIAMIFIGIFYPYREYWRYWQKPRFGIFAIALLLTWTSYIVASVWLVKQLYKKLFSRAEKLTTKEIWLLNIVTGNIIIWAAYSTTYYTSYLVGALSFSFILYLSISLWIYRKRNSKVFFDVKQKYADKKIELVTEKEIKEKLRHLFEAEELHKNPDLKLPQVAKLIEIKQHLLSQYLNDVLGKNFTAFVNEYRVLSAAEMIKTNNFLTIEAIGNECGFKSNSSFYTAFKKVKGITPAQYKKSL